VPKVIILLVTANAATRAERQLNVWIIKYNSGTAAQSGSCPSHQAQLLPALISKPAGSDTSQVRRAKHLKKHINKHY
jgi:hypothetical protein